MEELLYDLERLFEFDANDEKIFEFFDNNYEVIEYFIENKEYNYYYWIGAYPNLKPEHLAIIEKINQQYAVSGLFKNPNVSGEWLARKFKSKDSSIVRSAAEHPNLPLKVFKSAFKNREKDKIILRTLLANPSCPEEYLEDFFFNDKEVHSFLKTKVNLEAVMKNPKIPFKLFKHAIENHNDYYKYIDDMLARVELTKEMAKALDKKYPKKSNYFDRMILVLAENSGTKDNIVLQSFLASKIYQEYDNNYKKKIMNAIGKYLHNDDIIKVYRKLEPSHVTELTRNPNTPEEFVVNIILKAKIFHVNEMYDDYEFTQDELIRIVLETNDEPKKPTRGERFFDKYKEKFTSATLSEIFEKTNDEKFLPPEAKDMFLF